MTTIGLLIDAALAAGALRWLALARRAVRDMDAS